MKKLILLCLLTFSYSITFAEVGNSRADMRGKNLVVKNSMHENLFKGSDLKLIQNENNSSPKLNRSSQAPFFSEVFAGGIPPTWQNIDSSGSGVYWTWTTSGTFYSYPGTNDSLSVTDASASNGYLMFDSDSAQGTAQGEYGVLITEAIDCSLHSTVQLDFNEYFSLFNGIGAPLPNTARVYISTDASTWTLIHAADDGLVSNYDETPNPLAVSINISSYAAGQNTVYFKFSFTGAFSFWWFIDDFKLSETGAIDAGIFGIDDPNNGCQLSSSESIIVGLANYGVDTISNIPVSYSINGGVPVSEVVPDTIAPGDSLFYVFNAKPDLSLAGPYNIVSYVVYTGDTESSNDTMSISTVSFTPNTAVYSMGFEAGEDYTGYKEVDIDGDGITINISGTDPRTGSLCLIFPSPDTNITDAENWVISSCFDFQSSEIYTIDFWFKLTALASGQTPYNIEVYIGETRDVGTMNLISGFPTPTGSTYENARTNFTVASDGHYYLAFKVSGTNVRSGIRVDDIVIDITTAVGNNFSLQEIAVYPNPSRGMIYLENLSTTEGPANIIVMNAVGQVVSRQHSNKFTKETLDLSAQPEGIYTIQIISSSSVINKTIMVSSR